MNTPLFPIIKEVLIILIGLFCFLVLKDKIKEGTSLLEAFKNRLLQFVVSPFFLPGAGMVIVVAIYFIVYTLFFS
jgi:hypothetical protein